MDQTNGEKTAPRPRIQVLTWREYGDDESTTRIDAYSGDDKTDTWEDQVKPSLLRENQIDSDPEDENEDEGDISDIATVDSDIAIHDGDIIETNGRKFKVTITEVTEGDKP